MDALRVPPDLPGNQGGKSRARQGISRKAGGRGPRTLLYFRLHCNRKRRGAGEKCSGAGNLHDRVSREALDRLHHRRRPLLQPQRKALAPDQVSHARAVFELPRARPSAAGAGRD